MEREVCDLCEGEFDFSGDITPIAKCNKCGKIMCRTCIEENSEDVIDLDKMAITLPCECEVKIDWKKINA